MDRLISEKALLDKIDEWKGFDTLTIRLSTLRNIVKAIPSAEPTEEQIKAYIRKRKMVLVEDDFMVHIIKGTSEAYKGMTNGEVITKILKDAEWAELTSDFGLSQEDTIYIKVGGYWWNSPYKPQESEG